jgi:hypothetical protein
MIDLIGFWSAACLSAWISRLGTTSKTLAMMPKRGLAPQILHSSEGSDWSLLLVGRY